MIFENCPKYKVLCSFCKKRIKEGRIICPYCGTRVRERFDILSEEVRYYNEYNN